MKNKLIYLLVGMMFVFLNQETSAQDTLKCGEGPVIDTVEMSGVTINATSEVKARAEYGNRVANKSDLSCTNDCDADALEGSCTPKFEAWADGLPDVRIIKRGRKYKFPAQTISIKVSCEDCLYETDDTMPTEESMARRKNMNGDDDSSMPDALIDNLYPNPTHDEINLTLNPTEGSIQINVMDISGRLMKSFKVNSSGDTKEVINIDVSDLSTGIYHLNVVTDSETSSRKFSVNK